ncbi:MAG TPA: metallopeptidase family protein [Verrucomicrobiales bacterium]|nr:metallopeptidase family protein [Verrucomicrobiales bacterium]
MTEDVFRALPNDLREMADRVPIFLEAAAPSPDEDLLGCFEGSSLAEEAAGPEDSPRITLYLEAIDAYTEGDPVSFGDEVRVTLLHELGHFFGWNEDEVAARGLD